MAFVGCWKSEVLVGRKAGKFKPLSERISGGFLVSVYKC